MSTRSARSMNSNVCWRTRKIWMLRVGTSKITFWYRGKFVPRKEKHSHHMLKFKFISKMFVFNFVGDSSTPSWMMSSSSTAMTSLPHWGAWDSLLSPKTTADSWTPKRQELYRWSLRILHPRVCRLLPSPGQTPLQTPLPFFAPLHQFSAFGDAMFTTDAHECEFDWMFSHF